jgi:hypothetical protein
MPCSPQTARPPDWKSLYDAAIRESDPSKLPERIAAARNAILNRIQESMRNRALGEQCEMNDALRDLGGLEKPATLPKSFVQKHGTLIRRKRIYP